MLAAAHIINLLPSKLLHFKSPYELLFHKQPDYQHLKPFGCLCYISNESAHTDKLLLELNNVFFWDIRLTRKAIKLLIFLNLTKKQYVTRHVKFVEHVFPFCFNPPGNTTLTTSQMMFPSPQDTSLDHDIQFSNTPMSAPENEYPNPELSNSGGNSPSIPNHSSSPVINPIPVIKSTRTRKVPNKFKIL